MTTPNDPPNPCISHSKSKSLTPYRSPFSPTTNIRLSNMISLQLNFPPLFRPAYQYTNHVPMMTRYRTRKHLSRTPHAHRTERPTIRNDPVHRIRSLLLYRLLLSLLPLKPSPNPRTRRMLTTHRNSPPESPGSPPSKYISTPSLRCIHYLIPP